MMREQHHCVADHCVAVMQRVIAALDGSLTQGFDTERLS
jgi:hypothetical protein